MFIFKHYFQCQFKKRCHIIQSINQPINQSINQSIFSYFSTYSKCVIFNNNLNVCPVYISCDKWKMYWDVIHRELAAVYITLCLTFVILKFISVVHINISNFFFWGENGISTVVKLFVRTMQLEKQKQGKKANAGNRDAVINYFWKENPTILSKLKQ